MTKHLAIAGTNVSNTDYGNLYKNGSLLSSEVDDINIFGVTDNQSTSNPQTDKNVEALSQQLAGIQNKNGAILDEWNNLKESIGFGATAKKCNEAIEKYKNGEITLEEASKTINEFDNKQETSLNLFSNIASSIAAIAAVAGVVATVATGGLAAPLAIALGAGVGAITKAVFKTSDRATNEIDGDAINGKEIAKDALSGAVTGGIAVATMGTAASANTVKEAVIGCTKTGLKAGTISGSSNYMIDCTFDKDKYFNLGELIDTTAESAIVSGTVGAILGGVTGGLHATNTLNSGCSMSQMINNTTGAIRKSDVIANSACTAAYKVTGDQIQTITA